VDHVVLERHLVVLVYLVVQQRLECPGNLEILLFLHQSLVDLVDLVDLGLQENLRFLGILQDLVHLEILMDLWDQVHLVLLWHLWVQHQNWFLDFLVDQFHLADLDFQLDLDFLAVLLVLDYRLVL
jgi:hypothetical protein